jgi:hypothetical protein
VLKQRISDEAYFGTLEWCKANLLPGLKAEDIKEMPPGRPSKSMSCPCARLTGFCVGISVYSREVGGRSEVLPNIVSDFVKQFDATTAPPSIEVLPVPASQWKPEYDQEWHND